MSRSIFGVRIYTQTSISHDEIGLFNGVFCLSDGQVTSSGPWKYGMVPDNSLGDTDESADVRDGGNISQSGGFDVVFANAKEKASQILEDEGITLINKRADLIEIDSGSGLEYVRAIAVCSEISWHETDMILSFVDAGEFSDANISKAITDEDYPGVDSDFVGNWIPSTFGIIDKAKLVSVSTGEEYLTSSYICSNNNMHPLDATAFLVVSPSNINPTLKFRIMFGAFIYGGVNNWDKSRVVGKYLKPIIGQSVGKYRRIVDANLFTDPSAVPIPLISGDGIEITIDTFFEDTPCGDGWGKHAQQTWVSIVDIQKEFVVDNSEIAGFLDSNGVATTDNPVAYAFSDESKSKSSTTTSIVSTKYDYRLIPSYIASDLTTKHNALSFKLENFVDNPDTIESVIIFKPNDIALLSDQNPNIGIYLIDNFSLTSWALDSAQAGVLSGYKRYSDGLYLLNPNDYGGANPFSFDGTTNPPANAIDKSVSTFAQLVFKFLYNNGSMSRRFAMGYVVAPPTIEDDFDFDSVHLLIDCHTVGVAPFKNRELWIRYNKWAGFSNEILPDSIGKSMGIYGANYINDMVDSYYGGVNKNLYYFKPTPTASSYDHVTGYTNFTFSGISNMDQFRSILSICIIAKFWCNWAINDSPIAFRLTECAVAFLKSISIKDNIYCHVHGRVYGGTWGGRKTATAVITNPVDLLEYLDRRKNTAYYLPRRIDWGLEPTPDPLVNTSSDEGGYDWAYLASPKAQTIAFQAFTEDACSIKALQKKICAEFFLVKYRDGRGRECVNYIGDGIDVANIDKNITLADIPPEAKLGEVEECPHEDVVSSRITLRYKKNYGNDQYSSAITISNIYQPFYRSEYVNGYDGSLKQSLWQRAHYLWSLYGDSTSAKEKVIDLETIRDEDTAVWHLQRFLAFQGRRRRNVVVKYDTARKWNLFDHVALTLPDLNNGNEVEAIIEKKQAVRSRGVTNLGLVLLSGVGMESASWSSNSGSSASDSSSSNSLSGLSGSKSQSSSSNSGYSYSVSSTSDSSSSDSTSSDSTSSDSCSKSSFSHSSQSDKSVSQSSQSDRSQSCSKSSFSHSSQSDKSVSQSSQSDRSQSCSDSSFSLGNIVNDDLGNLGTAGTIPKFGATGLADSSITDDGTTVKTTLALGVGTSTPTVAGRIQCSENLLVGGSVGIGTTGPGAKLQVANGSTYAVAGTNSLLYLTTDYASSVGPAALVLGGNEAGATPLNPAIIQIYGQGYTGVSSYAANINFITSQGGSGTKINGNIVFSVSNDSNTPTEAMRIAAGGAVTIANLGVGIVHSSAAGLLTSSALVNGDFGNLGTAGTIPKFGATGLADSLLTEIATGINLTYAGTAQAVNDHLVLINPTNAADMDGTGTGILFRQWYYDAATPAIADAGRIGIAADSDWTAIAATRDARLSMSLVAAGVMNEYLRITAGVDTGRTFCLYTESDIWDSDYERESMGMVNKQYAQFGVESSSTGGFHLIAARDSSSPISITGRSSANSADNAGLVINLEKSGGAGSLIAYSDDAQLLSVGNNGSTKLAIFGDAKTLWYDVANVAHPFTDILPTDAWGMIRKDNTDGGIEIIGACDSVYTCVRIRGLAGVECGGTAIVKIDAAKSDGGTGTAAVSNTQLAHAFQNNATNIVEIYGNGDVKADGTVTVKVFNQASAPGTSDITSGAFAFWTDTDDSKCYVCYNHGGTIKKVELT